MIFIFSTILVLTYWIDIRISITISIILAFMIILRSIVTKRTININVKDKLFLAYAIFAIFPSLNNQMEFNLYVKSIIYPWMLSFIFQNIKYSLIKLKIIFFAIIISAAVIAIIMFFQSNPGTFEFDWQYILTKDRNYGFYFLDELVKVGPTTIASVLLVVLGGILSFQRFDFNLSSFNVVLFFVFFVLLVIAGGRISIITMILLLLFYFTQSPFSKRKGAIISLIGIVFLVMFFSIVFSYVIKFQGTIYLDRLYYILTPEQDSSAMTRVFLWIAAVELIFLYPMGLGYYYFFNKFGLTTHNEFLAQCVGGGVFSFLFFIIILISSLKLVYKELTLKRENIRIRFAAYFTFTILVIGSMAMFTENISLSSQNIFYPIFWICLGIFWSVKHNSDEAKRA